MANGTTRRIAAQEGAPNAEDIGTGVVFDPGAGKVTVVERFVQGGHPGQPLFATPLEGVDAVGLYPFDGETALARAGSAASIQLAEDVQDGDWTGWVVMIVDGAGAGQWAYIKAFNETTKQATPARNFEVTPDTTSVTRLLAPCWHRNELHVSPEFEDGVETSPDAIVIPVFYGYTQRPLTSGIYAGQQGMNGGWCAPECWWGGELGLDNHGIQLGAPEVRQADYYAGRTRTEPTRGATGAKLYLRTPPAGGGRVALKVTET